MAAMSEATSKLARWLPTLLGLGAALSVAALYELGVLGNDAPPPRDEPCCASEREPAPPPPSHDAPARPHAMAEAEREDLVEQLDDAKAREQLLAEQAITGEVRFTNLSQAELEAMARNCDVRSDYPVMIGPQDAAALELTRDEEAAYARAISKFAAEEEQLHRALLRELQPDLDVDAMPLAKVRTTLVKSLGRGKQPGDDDLRRTIAEERAGMRERSSEPGSVYERYTRARFEAGDRFAELLADELGAERSEELRNTFDGWQGAKLREHECPR
jgi:hypothetical protein